MVKFSITVHSVEDEIWSMHGEVFALFRMFSRRCVSGTCWMWWIGLCGTVQVVLVMDVWLMRCGTLWCGEYLLWWIGLCGTVVGLTSVCRSHC